MYKSIYVPVDNSDHSNRAVACAVACLAVPFAVGGAAAVSGALAGEWWLVAGLAVAAIVVSVAVVRRRQAGKIC